jgi:hypothetical protein
MTGSSDKLTPKAHTDASVIRGASIAELMNARGVYTFECFDKDGNFKWRDTIENVVATVGKNQVLDAALAGAAYTVTGPFMGLISSVSYTTGPAAGDTMASHGGWTEAGATNAPTYTVPRKTAAWAAASAGAKALSAALQFAITGSGTIKGSFMVFGAGAVATVDSTAGVLLSAGLFSGGDKIVANGDTLNVSYSLSL